MLDKHMSVWNAPWRRTCRRRAPTRSTSPSRRWSTCAHAFKKQKQKQKQKQTQKKQKKGGEGGGGEEEISVEDGAPAQAATSKRAHRYPPNRRGETKKKKKKTIDTHQSMKFVTDSPKNSDGELLSAVVLKSSEGKEEGTRRSRTEGPRRAVEGPRFAAEEGTRRSRRNAPQQEQCEAVGDVSLVRTSRRHTPLARPTTRSFSPRRRTHARTHAPRSRRRSRASRASPWARRCSASP